MSRGRNSAYPERPIGGRRPSKPGEASKKASSEHISGKRKIWVELPGSRVVKPRESFDKLDMNRTIFGHAGPAMVAFLKKYRHNRVPIHVWGKKGKTAEA